jgi:hypothetical protein
MASAQVEARPSSTLREDGGTHGSPREATVLNFGSDADPAFLAIEEFAATFVTQLPWEFPRFGEDPVTFHVSASHAPLVPVLTEVSEFFMEESPELTVWAIPFVFQEPHEFSDGPV